MSRCKVVGINEDGRMIPYRCRREAGHEGPCAMEIDAEVTQDEAQVRPSHYKILLRDARLINRAGEPAPPGNVTVDVEIEAIDIIEALGFETDAYLTTALLYLLRLGQKDLPRVEIKKAIWWLQRRLTLLERTP